MRKEQDDFIMLPVVDFCFKELMKNPKVRKGIVAPLLGVRPEYVRETSLLPTDLPGDYPEDKTGVLDVEVLLEDGTLMNLEMQVKYFKYWDERTLFYISRMFAGQLKQGEQYKNLKKCIHVSILDFIRFPEDEECYRRIHFRDDKIGSVYSDKLELQILELKKLPKELREGDDVALWMKFFSGRRKEDFEEMAKTSEYLDEAYNTLVKLSADEKLRRQYEARDKALRDHNAMMSSARELGYEQGHEEGRAAGHAEGRAEGRAAGHQEGIQEGVQQARQIFKLHMAGKTVAEIAQACRLSEEYVREILA